MEFDIDLGVKQSKTKAKKTDEVVEDKEMPKVTMETDGNKVLGILYGKGAFDLKYIQKCKIGKHDFTAMTMYDTYGHIEMYRYEINGKRVPVKKAEGVDAVMPYLAALKDVQLLEVMHLVRSIKEQRKEAVRRIKAANGGVLVAEVDIDGVAI